MSTNKFHSSSQKSSKHTEKLLDFSASSFLQIKRLYFHQLFFMEHNSSSNQLHTQSLQHDHSPLTGAIYLYMWVQNAIVTTATCKNTFDKTTHLLLILQHNDCHLQLADKICQQLQWVSHGICATPTLHGKWVTVGTQRI